LLQGIASDAELGWVRWSAYEPPSRGAADELSSSPHATPRPRAHTMHWGQRRR